MTLSSTIRRIGLLMVLVMLCLASLRHQYQLQSLIKLAYADRDCSYGDNILSPSSVKDTSTPSPWPFLRLSPLVPVPPTVPAVSSDIDSVFTSLISFFFTLSSITATQSSASALSGTWGVIATLLLGFLLGVLISETPFVDPFLRLFGLTDSRRFGVDILEGTAWTHGGGASTEGAIWTHGGSIEGTAQTHGGGASTEGGRGMKGVDGSDGNQEGVQRLDEAGDGAAGNSTNTTTMMTPSSSSRDDQRTTTSGKQPMKHGGQKRIFNYGLQYSFLNVEVTGGWLGMGLWPKDGSKVPYREACQAMVRKVTAGLQIDATSHILDVGFGCGDQTVYMAELYRPNRITGMTIEPLQHYAAEQLVLNSRDKTPTTAIELYVADACQLPEFLKEHPRVLGSESQQLRQHFTHIISIDSAYHYNTRRQFFEHAYSTLAPGHGRLAMADVIPRQPPPTKGLHGWAFQMFCRLYLKVPIENLKTLEAYRQDLVEVGFQDIEIEAVEDQVFLGWADFITTQLRVLKSVGLVRPRVGWAFWWLQKVLRSIDRNKTLQFIVVKARRGD